MRFETRTTVEKKTLLTVEEVADVLAKHLKLKNAKIDFNTNSAGDFTGATILETETTVR